MKNLFAYTEPGANLPAYVSINKRDDRVFLTARSRGGSAVAEVEIPAPQLAELRKALKPSIGQQLIGS